MDLKHWILVHISLLELILQEGLIKEIFSTIVIRLRMRMKMSQNNPNRLLIFEHWLIQLFPILELCTLFSWGGSLPRTSRLVRPRKLLLSQHLFSSSNLCLWICRWSLNIFWKIGSYFHFPMRNLFELLLVFLHCCKRICLICLTKLDPDSKRDEYHSKNNRHQDSSYLLWKNQIQCLYYQNLFA